MNIDGKKILLYSLYLKSVKTDKLKSRACFARLKASSDILLRVPFSPSALSKTLAPESHVSAVSRMFCISIPINCNRM